MTSPTPKPGIRDIALYVGGRSAVPGVAKSVKLSSNESALGPSPKAMEALRAAAHDLELYPDGSSGLLRQAIGGAFGLDPARILVGGKGRAHYLPFWQMPICSPATKRSLADMPF